jgi:hypothetical protein
MRFMNGCIKLDRAKMEQELVLEGGTGKWLGQSYGQIRKHSLRVEPNEVGKQQAR